MAKNPDENKTDAWVSERLAELSPLAHWEPDTDRAFERVYHRAVRMLAERRSRVWLCAGVSLACLLAVILVRVDPNGTRAGQAPSAAAVFTDGDALLRPEAYREWIVVGSSMGLGYSESPGAAPRAEVFQNVYMNPSAYREFIRSGEFPEGTVMVLEVSSAETPPEPGLEGKYAAELVALEASVKDARFDGGWGYFGFTDSGGRPRAASEAFPASACWSCHAERAETDHVFTQFYPALKAARAG